ncbi:MAG TPA: hypothetical protein VFQ35_15070, partial [Polyangiaceae bacterium]|nr:hypothetical protein [Polyangiaceae bacterium]
IRVFHGVFGAFWVGSTLSAREDEAGRGSLQGRVVFVECRGIPVGESHPMRFAAPDAPTAPDRRAADTPMRFAAPDALRRARCASPRPMRFAAPAAPDRRAGCASPRRMRFAAPDALRRAGCASPRPMRPPRPMRFAAPDAPAGPMRFAASDAPAARRLKRGDAGSEAGYG